MSIRLALSLCAAAFAMAVLPAQSHATFSKRDRGAVAHKGCVFTDKAAWWTRTRTWWDHSRDARKAK